MYNNMRKNKIVIHGAYDRYNYGDNLMPLVISDYLKKYRPEVLNRYEIIFSSISDSDLSEYNSPKTISIGSVLGQLDSEDVIIIAGGEVLCAPLSTLYLHMPKPKWINDTLTFVNRIKIVNKSVKIIANLFYPCPWSFPYIPDKSTIKHGVKIIYNTIGGSLDGVKGKEKEKIIDNLKGTSYLSVRDIRTQKSLTSNGIKSTLVPDSVHIISDLYHSAFFEENASNIVNKYKNLEYICFQAAPKKLGDSIEHVAKELKEICRNNNCKVLLLPIGYAAGHDDFYVLDKIRKEIPSISMIENDLTLWEIMYLISNSKLYIGTSLHGAITALSFSVPHFGLNKKITKLDDFLKTWSVPPFNGCFNISEIQEKAKDISSFNFQSIREKSKTNNIEVLEHFESLVNKIVKI